MEFRNKCLAAVSALALLGSVAAADEHTVGDAKKGEAVFKKCKACHKVGEGAGNGAGPNLNDLIGRTAGAVEGFKYGSDLSAAGEAGLIWTAELVSEFIENPKEFLRSNLDDSSAKSKMTLKFKKESDRANVIAYIALFSPSSGEASAETE
jgi:cytochrome c2